MAAASSRKEDTRCERLLRSALWRLGLRFHKNVASLAGKPDAVFARAKVAVFCDGDFWHGRNWEKRVARLKQGTNADYWTAKIAKNIERDHIYTQQLTEEGWKVLRFWERDILRDPDGIAVQIACEIHHRLASRDG
jgi:DNA mismatch endonuclease (patch repair protein)